MRAFDRVMLLPPNEQMREFIGMHLRPGVPPSPPPPGEPPPGESIKTGSGHPARCSPIRQAPLGHAVPSSSPHVRLQSFGRT